MRSDNSRLPRILVIDDVYGREVAGGNDDRVALCLQLLLKDVSRRGVTEIRLAKPLAEAVFCRGQVPHAAAVGDVVTNDLEGTLRVIEQGWHERPTGSPPWALVLLDLRFRDGRVTAESERQFGPGMPEGCEDDDSRSFFGLRVLEEIQRRHPQLPVIVLSDAPRDLVSRDSSTFGAVAFLSKGDPAASTKLAEHLHRHGLLPDPEGQIIGNSIPLLVALRNARRAALTGESILIRGETGTGKELLARFIHRNDPRRHAGPLVMVDSGTLRPELYESELFGHTRGSFTGAIQDRMGRIVEANRGILFLDEIGNIDSTVQPGLLRVLQEKMVCPVGGTRPRPVDVRFIFATNEDIEARAAAENGFRFDLLERIRQGGTIVLPPLRDRLDDLPLLVEALVRKVEDAVPGALRRHIDEDVFDVLRRQAWRGNIRQLHSCVINAVTSRPDMDYLVPVHLDLAEEAAPRIEVEVRERERATLFGAISTLHRLDAAYSGPGELIGRYSEFEAAFASAASRYLRACIEIARKPTLRNPDGDVLVQPAVKLMLGESKLSATQAYDFVIRLRNLSASVSHEWDQDAVLGPLFQRARTQRRSRRSLRGEDAAHA